MKKNSIFKEKDKLSLVIKHACSRDAYNNAKNFIQNYTGKTESIIICNTNICDLESDQTQLYFEECCIPTQTIRKVYVKIHHNYSLSHVIRVGALIFCTIFEAIECINETIEFTDKQFIKIRNDKPETTTQNFLIEKGLRGMCHYRNQFIFSICGAKKDKNVNTCEKYSICNNEWTMLARTNEEKYSVNGLSIGDVLYIFGGYRHKEVESNSLKIEKIHILNGKQWIHFEVVSPLVKNMGECYPIYLGQDQLIIAGKGYPYDSISNFVIINLVKGKAVKSIKSSICHQELLSCVRFSNAIYYATTDKIIELNKNGIQTNAHNLSQLYSHWEATTISIQI